MNTQDQVEAARLAEAKRDYVDQVNAHRDDREIFQPGRALVTALRYQAAEPNRSYSYGPGHGLESDSAIALETFSDGRWLRAFDRLIVADILKHSAHDSEAKIELVMGDSPVGRAARVIIGEIQGPGDAGAQEIWELWRENDQVAAEMLCWHTVARLRMAGEGHFPPYVDAT